MGMNDGPQSTLSRQTGRWKAVNNKRLCARGRLARPPHKEPLYYNGSMIEIEKAGISVRCWSAVGDHRWCLLCRHRNGVLDVKRLRQMRDVYLQRRLDGNETPEDQRECEDINEALMLLNAA